MSSLILILISLFGSWLLYEPGSGDLVTDRLCGLVLFVSFVALLIWVYKRISKSTSSSDSGGSWFDGGDCGGDGGGD